LVKYTIFETSWGYFGLAGTENALLRTHLPVSKAKRIETNLLKSLPEAKYDRWLLNPLQRYITAYFEGGYVDFDRAAAIKLAGFSEFGRRTLTACRKIKLGQTISYGRLAKRLGRPAASRAVGNILARNPLPLIIPCHRIIRSDGNPGRFSAAGGVRLKEKLLRHEKKIIANC